MGHTILGVQHTSLQSQDTRKEQEHDVKKLFTFGTNFPIKTGTEAGRNPLRDLLEEYAKKHNHYLHFARDNWIAVNKDIVKRGSVKRDRIFVVEKEKTAGRGHDSVAAMFGFDHIDNRVGRITQLAVHYPLKGRFKTGPNWQWNELYAKRIAETMKREASGSDIAFVNGDFNMNDARPGQDWAFGYGFTSMADELQKHRNTGHGPIDGLCSYDRDGRVSAHSFNVLNDQQFFLYSDHFMCRGKWKIRHLKI